LVIFVTDKPTDWRALCAELADALDEWQLGGGPPEDTADADLIARARTALAQPEPEVVTDEEEWYPGFADWLEREMPEGTVIGDPLWWASKIADYLQRHAHPAIEPVAYLRRQGNYTEASEFSLSEEEKARGWTEEPLYIHHALPLPTTHK
jgi:alkanesulfonate monooxygenase SsuD/methylene tetrahydromethanopterin reductase-like flavin-dependent oxidoreductase (luciferase family)